MLGMELFEWIKSTLYSGVEVAARYPIGQALLYQTDRVLWVLEKSAQWAVPPINDGDDSSSKPKELVRPLPWIFFLWLLVVMRLSREALSILALIRGRPPIRPANVVTYIQGRRRFLRWLKHQGLRSMRSKSAQGMQGSENIYNKVKSLMAYMMCFRKAETHYVNNNSALSQSTEDKVLVVRRSKKRREDHRQGYAYDSDDSDENAMERFLDKMDHLNDDSAMDDSDYTIKNAESAKSDTSVTSDEEPNSTLTDISSHNTASSTPQKEAGTDKSTSKASLSQSNTEDTLLSNNKNSSKNAEKSVSPKTATMEVLASERNGHAEPPTKDKGEVQSEVPTIKNKPHSPRRPSPHKLANGSLVRDEPRNTEIKEIPIRQNSDIPVLKITTVEEGTDEQNQGVEEPQKAQI